MKKALLFLLILAVAAGGYVWYAQRATEAQLPLEAGMGPSPTLPEPRTALVPLINVRTAVGWRENEGPVAAQGLQVQKFADNLSHPRWIHVLPNGDVLVAESNAPERPDDAKGVRGAMFKFFQKRGGGGPPSANRITLLRDEDGDGVAEVRDTYEAGATRIPGASRRVTDLPAGTLNHHWTKNVVASADGTKLYVSIGSNSNAAENGIDKEAGRAQIWEINVATGSHRTFASVLRNPVGMDRNPTTNELWTAVNERDELGSDLVPDYMTSVKDGDFFGWPYSYFGPHVDTRVSPQQPELVSKARMPDYALGAHTASLGLAFARAASIGPAWTDGAFVGQHGSWNRKPPSGYRVIFVPFKDGKPDGFPRDVLTGFLNEKGDARGRPVGVALDGKGGLLVADDVGNVIWRVSSKP